MVKHAVPLAPSSDKKAWRIWDPPLVDRHAETGKITRLAETGYTQSGTNSQAYLRLSTDEGETWSESVKVPQWKGTCSRRRRSPPAA